MRKHYSINFLYGNWKMYNNITQKCQIASKHFIDKERRRTKKLLQVFWICHCCSCCIVVTGSITGSVVALQIRIIVNKNLSGQCLSISSSFLLNKKRICKPSTDGLVSLILRFVYSWNSKEIFKEILYRYTLKRCMISNSGVIMDFTQD